MNAPDQNPEIGGQSRPAAAAVAAAVVGETGQGPGTVAGGTGAGEEIGPETGTGAMTIGTLRVGAVVANRAGPGRRVR